ncbi:MAG: type II toxin-antitoxin system HicB family antitoxin [Armatimonadetes bacterium]|nr:type II toxin-antitoxin system HicB family antitoxin [Armatimonadota bacterium]MDW8029611.1 type II toxin-antitoxin system HicB family antitoxin [Armatimonadota bacterium]
MQLQRTVKAIVRKGERLYVAECIEIPIVTQGETLDELVAKLREAVALHLESEYLNALGLAPNPNILVMMELELDYAEVETIVRRWSDINLTALKIDTNNG